MSEPLEQINKVRPDVEIDPLIIATAKESLMKEIASETLTGRTSNVAEVDKHARRRSSGLRGARRHRSILAIAAALFLTVAGIGAYSILGRDDGFEVTNDEVPTDEVVDQDDKNVSDTDTDADAEESFEPVTDFSSSTFRFDVDEILVTIDDGEEYQPVGDVHIYNTLDLRSHASGGRGIGGNEDTFESVNGYADPHPNPFVDYERHRVESLEFGWGHQTSEPESAEAQMSFSYASDGTDWWVYEVQAYGDSIPSRMFAHGEFFRSSLGTAFNGDIEIDLRSRADSETPDRTGKLTLSNATLEAFRTPTECVESQEPFVLTVSEESIVLDVSPSLFNGGGVRVGLVDVETCTIAALDEYTISGVVEDDEIVRIFSEERDGGVSFHTRAIKSGQTVLDLKATENATGTVVASVEIPVSASTPDVMQTVCSQAQSESNGYLLKPFVSSSLQAGATVPYPGEVQLWNAETCQPEPLSNYIIEVISNDRNVVDVELGIEQYPIADEGFSEDAGSISLTMTPANVGETTITVTVMDKETGEVVAELDSPVETIEQ